MVCLRIGTPDDKTLSTIRSDSFNDKFVTLVRLRGYVCRQGHPEFATPSGKTALWNILRGEGLEQTQWGQDQETDSIAIGRHFLEHFSVRR
jgi:hypothetical protein